MEAVVELKRRRPEVGCLVVKLNRGFSGEGSAIFPCEDAPEGGALARWVRDELPRRIRFEASGETWERYCHKLAEMGESSSVSWRAGGRHAHRRCSAA